MVPFITCVWEGAPAVLRAVIMFVMTFEACAWDPFRKKADYTAAEAAFRFIPMIAAFMQPAVVGQGYIAYAETCQHIIGAGLVFTAKNVGTHLDRIRAARIALLGGEAVEQVFEVNNINSADEWRNKQPMGDPKRAAEIADLFVTMVDACDNPGTLLNSPLEYPVARMIQAHLIEFFIVSESKVRHIGLQCCLIALTLAR
jgi:hypothetical protein